MGRVVLRLEAGLAAILLGGAYGGGNMAHGQETISVVLNPDKVVGRIDEKIYGHFLEHIYHSVNGGLWGEMVWDRSFEEFPGGFGGQWSVEGDRITQSSFASDTRLFYGDPEWRDYEYTLEGRKTNGAEGFLILFRVAGENEFYWANLGGWNNSRHALEKSAKTGGRGTVGPDRRGRIESDRWYRIRVRCEGPHSEVWLDDEKVLDFTDEENAHLAGRVGLGTWMTAAEYRNIEVKSLDGKTLFHGLPEVRTAQLVARYWHSYGPGKVDLTKDNPLNSEFSHAIESMDGETGVQQEPFYIREGEVYRGSLWARGDAPGGLVVRLLDGERTLGEVTLKSPESEWKEYEFRFSPNKTAENATLQVGVRGPGKVWLDQVGMMSDAARKTGGFRPDLLKAIADLKPPVIRWPGGCFAEWYRWKDCIGPQERRVKYPIDIWDDRDVSSFGTDEYIALCRKVGAEPLIVINIGSHYSIEKRAEYIQEACDWIEYCNGPADSKWGKVRAQNGHAEPYHVKFWEICNETWFMGSAAYIQAVLEFVPPMKKADPSIKIAACGSPGFGMDWNRDVIKGFSEVVDYLSIHHYEDPNRFAEGPGDYERFIRGTGDLIAESKNPKMKIYCSEWNAQSTDWRTGLYAGGLLNGFERLGDVFEMGGPALFLRHVSAGDWDNAFINFDHRTWFPAPNYVVMKLWREHYAPTRVETTGDTGPLNAVATKSEDGKTLCYKVVNPEGKAVNVDLLVDGGFPLGKATIQLVAPDSLDARNTLESPNAVHPVSGKVEQDGRKIRFTLPRWSAAVATIPER